MVATVNSPTPKTQESEVSNESSEVNELQSKLKKNPIKRDSTPDKLADLNRPYVPRTTFDCSPHDSDMADPLMFLNLVSAPTSYRSIIKKESTLKSSHEIEQAKIKKQQAKLQKPTRKVQFADLILVDDVDDYMRNEESNYHKVTKIDRPRKHKRPSSDEDRSLSKKDGLD